MGSDSFLTELVLMKGPLQPTFCYYLMKEENRKAIRGASHKKGKIKFQLFLEKGKMENVGDREGHLAYVSWKMFAVDVDIFLKSEPQQWLTKECKGRNAQSQGAE